MSLIQASNLCYSYKNYDDDSKEHVENQVLFDVNIDIEDGQFVAILGHNGSGKSTFAKHINAILRPKSGTVIVDGIDTSKEELIFEIRQQVGMVFQNPDNQIVATIVEEDVAFALENLGVEQKEIVERVEQSLKSVEMYEYKNKAPHQLSGGQKQRVAIAGILAMRPKCIVLDEPTAMLDPRGRQEVIKTILQLNKEFNTTVVFITHFMDEAVQADRVIVIDAGKVILDDTPIEVFSNVKMLKDIGLDVPQATELVDSLGLKHVLTVDECVEQIAKVLGG